MNTILLSFAIVLTLVNLTLALSTLGYVAEMSKHMEEWFKMFGTLTEACSKLCDGNGNVITSLMNHIEYTEKKFAEKKKEVQELNDKYDKLYEEFKKLEEAVDECRDYRFEKYLKGLDPDYLLEHQYEEDELEDAEEENIGDQDGDEEFKEFIKKIEIPRRVEGKAIEPPIIITSTVSSNVEDGGQND